MFMDLFLAHPKVWLAGQLEPSRACDGLLQRLPDDAGYGMRCTWRAKPLRHAVLAPGWWPPRPLNPLYRNASTFAWWSTRVSPSLDSPP